MALLGSSARRNGGEHAFRRATAQRRTTYQASARRVRDLVRSSIRLGMVEGASLGTEHDLVHELAATRGAVRQGLALLVEEGLLSRAPRLGTRLVADILATPLSSSLPLQGCGPETAQRMEMRQTERLFIPTTVMMRRRLETDDASALLTEQIVSVDGRPVAVRTAYCPQSLVTTRLLSDRSGPYGERPFGEVLEWLFGVPFGSVENTVEAARCDARTATQLAVEPGAPVLRRELLVRDARQRPHILSYTHYVGDRVALTADTAIR